MRQHHRQEAALARDGVDSQIFARDAQMCQFDVVDLHVPGHVQHITVQQRASHHGCVKAAFGMKLWLGVKERQYHGPASR